jgi:hypothetical protein
VNDLDYQMRLRLKYELINEDDVKYDEMDNFGQALQMLHRFPNDSIKVTLVPMMPKPIGSDK